MAERMAQKVASKGPKTRYDGRPHGLNKEDVRPLASRRLTLREMRDAGIWIPVTSKKEKRSGG